MSLVIRNNVKLITDPIDGTGDDLLTRNSTTKELGSISPIDTSTFLTSTLQTGYFLIGNANIATPTLITGQVTFTSLGVSSISADTITNTHINSGAGIVYTKLNLSNSIINTDINSAAGINRSKLANGNINRIIINNGSGVLSEATAITADRVIVSDASGLPIESTISTTTLAFLDASSSIQTQLDNKLDFSSGISPLDGDIIYYSSGSWINLGIGTDGETLTIESGLPVWRSAVSNGLPVGGTINQVLKKIDSTPFNSQWSDLTLSLISDVTSTVTEINQFTGVTTTTVQYNFLNTLTSNVQTQLDTKLNNSLPYNSLFVGDAGNNAIALAAGTNGHVLTIQAGVPTWIAPTPPGNVSSATAPSVDNELVRFNGTIGDSIQGGSGIVISDTGAISFPTAGALQTSTSGTNTLLLRAYDVDGTAYVTFATLTAGNTPTFNLEDSVTKAGSYIYRVGGTDISLADGGTGASLVDPGADAIFVWDNTLNESRLAILSGLTYDSGTNTLTAIGSGIGGSTGATDNVILRADGTGGSTLQSSPVVISDTGNITFGVSGVTTGTTRLLTVEGVSADISLSISTKGVGDFSLFSDSIALAADTQMVFGALNGVYINGGINSGELRIYEPSGSGVNYNAFKTVAQAVDITYTLPTVAPAVNGYVLSSTTAGVMSWVATSGGSGDVVGPASATDNAITRFDSTTGKLIQNSTLYLDDSGSLTDSGGLEFIRFSATASAVNEITVINAAASGSPRISATGADTNIGIQLVGKGTGNASLSSNGVALFWTGSTLLGSSYSLDGLSSIKDTNSNEYLTFSQVASAVNQLTMTNAATGNAPTLSASGDDTDIDINITPKGAGKINLLIGVDNDASGFKHARVTTGSVAAGTTALVTITWTTPFADANYTVNASVVEATTSSLSLSVVHVESITASAVTVRVLNNSVGSLTGTVHVLAIHD